VYNELNYITHNEGYVDSCNTWLQGCIECSYQDLVNVFGVFLVKNNQPISIPINLMLSGTYAFRTDL
jgi:hypothetical protein